MGQKVYRYRKHIRRGQYAIAAIAAIFGLMFAIPAYYLIVLDLPIEIRLFAALLLGLLFMLLLAVSGATWYFYYRLAGVNVSIDEDTVVYTTRTATSRICLDDITALEFPSVKYTGGWLKIITPEKVIRLTVVLEDIGDFLLELKSAMDASGQSNRYDRAQLFGFLKTARYSDRSWVRMYKYGWKLLTVTLVGLPFIIGWSLAAGPDFAIFLSAILCILIPNVAVFGVEIILGRRFAKETDEEAFYCPPPNPELERRLYRQAAWIAAVFFGLGMVCVILLK